MLEEEAMEYVSKEEVFGAIEIKQIKLQFEREKQEKAIQIREMEMQI